MIKFRKEDHSYSAEDVVYTSVSKVIAKYKNDFDKDHWSAYKALEVLIPNFKEIKRGWNIESPEFIAYASSLVDPAELQVEINKILKSWQKENTKSILKGNAYHERKEKKSYSRGFEINPFTKQDFPVIPEYTLEEGKTSLISNLYELEDGYYPELLIWDEECLIAGQADKVFVETIGDVRYVDLDDWKSNKKISMNGFKGRKMKAPLNHLQDANHSHYNLQLSMYAYMLEKFGFVVRNLAFHHFNQMYPLKYLRDEVKLITC